MKVISNDLVTFILGKQAEICNFSARKKFPSTFLKHKILEEDMKNIRTLVACLSLIIAGIMFSTGTAYAAGTGTKGGDTTCTTQLNPYGHPLVRCTVQGGEKVENGAATKDWHRHHHYHHRFYHCWSRCHSRHHVRHFHHSCHRHR